MGAAQIAAGGNAYRDTAGYVGQDPIFVFNRPCGQAGTGGVTIAATAPGAIDSCNFYWTSYNPGTNAFDIPLQTDTLAALSSLSGTLQGGYQVRITRDSMLDTTFRAWVFQHHLSVAVLKTADGKVLSNKYTCEYLDLNGSFSSDTFTYYNPSNGQAIQLDNQFNTWWSSQNAVSQVNNVFSELNTRTYSPPVYDTHYSLQVSDKLGASCTDSVLYVTIQTKALFTYKFDDITGKTTGFVDMDPAGESAPATFQFQNQSINGVEYEWMLIDSALMPGEVLKPVISTDTSDKPEYTYYIPRNYKISLVSRSKEHCVDTAFSQVPITIKFSEMKVPNVFTPNGDGRNDHFIIYPYDDETSDYPVKFASIRTFHITIISRWGKKVHEFSGDINKWVADGGWDGKVQGTNLDALPGIYYYIIDAIGYDNVVYKGKSQGYMGYFYLYR